MKGGFGLPGVPSSAAAHGPGQEKAPAALPSRTARAAGRGRRARRGLRRPARGAVAARPDQRRPHNLRAVLDVLRKTSGRVGEILPTDGSRWCWAANAASPSRCCPHSGTGASSRRCSPWTAAWTCSPRPPTPRDPRLHGRGAPCWTNPGPPSSCPVSARPGLCSAAGSCSRGSPRWSQVARVRVSNRPAAGRAARCSRVRSRGCGPSPRPALCHRRRRAGHREGATAEAGSRALDVAWRRQLSGCREWSPLRWDLVVGL
jgi:hypothetical protein